MLLKVYLHYICVSSFQIKNYKMQLFEPEMRLQVTCVQKLIRLE
jgi:hypothetical protein